MCATLTKPNNQLLKKFFFLIEINKLNFIYEKNIFVIDAPQGRAFDIASFLERQLLPSFSLIGGYRMIEDGADNDSVYNMAWFHNIVIGLRGDF